MVHIAFEAVNVCCESDSTAGIRAHELNGLNGTNYLPMGKWTRQDIIGNKFRKWDKC